MKESFFKILKEKYINKHKEDNNILREEYGVDNISFLKQSDVTRKEKILRNLLSLVDVLVENAEVSFGLSNLDFYHKVSLRKAIIGSIKGINKHKEIHFILIFFDLQIREYIKRSEDIYKEIFLFKVSKIFLNAKLEYGLYPQGFNSLLNTLNLKTEISNIFLEVSTRAINQIFKLIVKFN
jgi:hypothetical protein